MGDLFTDRTEQWCIDRRLKWEPTGRPSLIAIDRCEAYVSDPTRVLSHIRSKKRVALWQIYSNA